MKSSPPEILGGMGHQGRDHQLRTVRVPSQSTHASKTPEVANSLIQQLSRQVKDFFYPVSCWHALNSGPYKGCGKGQRPIGPCRTKNTTPQYIYLVDVSDIFYFSAPGRGRGVRGARKRGVGFIFSIPGGGAVSQERGGGRRAGRVSVGDWGGG